jgi:hypothetical protein
VCVGVYCNKKKNFPAFLAKGGTEEREMFSEEVSAVPPLGASRRPPPPQNFSTRYAGPLKMLQCTRCAQTLMLPASPLCVCVCVCVCLCVCVCVYHCPLGARESHTARPTRSNGFVRFSNNSQKSVPECICLIKRLESRQLRICGTQCAVMYVCTCITA